MMGPDVSMDANKLNTLSVTEYNLIANKNPQGSYDRSTRENLHGIIRKLASHLYQLSSLELKLYRKFQHAQFRALEEKEKRVTQEVARYHLSSRVKGWAKGISVALVALVITILTLYELVLDADGRRQVDVAWYAGLNKVGLVSREELDQIRVNLNVAQTRLQKTKRENEELARALEQMILNNKITENLKYIIKQIYNDERARYEKKSGQVVLSFNNKEIARYDSDPAKWYLLGVIGSGVTRVFYNNDQILEIETIFGRKGEETPVGDYEIRNKVPRPTWYKKEDIDGRVRVKAIPFGDPEHEIGHWWLGLKRLGDPVPGSYGIHGVNPSRINDFFKKNYDWRSGSAGCPNIQDWYLNFLAEVVPIGTRMTIAVEDKWDTSPNATGQLVGSL